MTGVQVISFRTTTLTVSSQSTPLAAGLDSIMVERISRAARKFNKPVLNLSVDEQTGEAGFVTRIEAFTDMLFRKKRASIINKIDIKESAKNTSDNNIEITKN